MLFRGHVCTEEGGGGGGGNPAIEERVLMSGSNKPAENLNDPAILKDCHFLCLT
jgi:hypothetical protein